MTELSTQLDSLNMAQEFQNWISNKKFEIFDNFNEISNKDKNDSIVLSNELFKTSDIRVYHSKSDIIESIVSNTIKTGDNQNVLNWFNDIKLRKQVIQRIYESLIKSTKVLQLLDMNSSKSTLKVSATRVQNLLNTLKYAVNNQIYDHSNQIQFKNIKHSIIKIFDLQSFLLKLIYEWIPCLISGIPVIFVSQENASISVSYLLDLCLQSGLEPAIIQSVITDPKNAQQLTKTTKPQSVPTFVLFESADIECGIDAIVNTYLNDTINSLNVFVQQSIYQKFCDQIKSRLTNGVEIGDQLDPNADTISKINVNYNGIDFDNEYKAFDFQIFKFRTNDELKTLIQHFVQISYISLWAEKTSLALEFASVLNSSSNIYINSPVKHPIKTQICLLDKIGDKIDLKDLKVLKSLFMPNNNWKLTSEEEREEIIRNFIVNHENAAINLQSFGNKIINRKDINGFELRITGFEAIGLIVFNLGDKFDDKMFALILDALVCGNCVVVCGGKQNPKLLKLEEYMNSAAKDAFYCIDTIDKKVEGNAVLTVGDKVIGFYLQQYDQIWQKSFVKFEKSITLSFGDISFAK